MRAIAVLLVLAVVTPGCASGHHHARYASDHSRSGPGRHSGHGGPSAGEVAEGIEAFANILGAIASAADSSGSDAVGSASDNGPPPLPIDLVATLDTLGRIDLSACHERGVPPREGRARITFRADGAVTAVDVTYAPGMSPATVACVAEHLNDATAPPFEGAPVDVWASFHVP
jgi:hypothetical protein